jgi:hypothetical protein
MRSNGLTASSYSPIADLNPTVAEGLLDELKGRQIAAYCQPIETSTVSGFERPEFLVEVLVRLYVDAAATGPVLEMLRALDPDLVQANDDLRWAQIVAGYDAPTTTQVVPWPVYEDLDPSSSDASDSSASGSSYQAVAEPAVPDDSWGTTTRRRSARFEDTDEDGRFVPPPPPPLPRLGVADQLGWLGLIGGPTVLVAAAVFSLSPPAWVTLIAALGFICGFVSLVVRMDNGDGRLDDPDNGAQV